MVFQTAPPQPASKARMTCPAVLVGGAEDSQNGFGERMPAKVTERSGFWDSDIRSSLFPTQAKALEWATGESCLGFYQITIQVRATVAEELPRFANFGDAVEVQVSGEDFVAVACGLGD